MSEILRPEFPLGSVTFRHVRDGIFIRQDDYYRKCLYTDLLWVEASGSYCDLICANGRASSSLCASE